MLVVEILRSHFFIWILCKAHFAPVVPQLDWPHSECWRAQRSLPSRQLMAKCCFPAPSWEPGLQMKSARKRDSLGLSVGVQSCDQQPSFLLQKERNYTCISHPERASMCKHGQSLLCPCVNLEELLSAALHESSLSRLWKLKQSS